MKSLLERLKLLDHFTMEIPMERKDFVDKLKQNVDPGDIGAFSSAFEVFSSSKNEYKGKVTFDSFKIRRRRKFFDTSMSLAVAEGHFKQKGDFLVIESTIKSFRTFFYFFLAFILIFYAASIATIILSDDVEYMDWLFLPAILLHALFMLGIPYLMMRRGVSRLRYELERDFYYLTK